MAIFDKFNAKDRELFNFDIRALDWDEYNSVLMRGFRLHILKEPLTDLDTSRKHTQKMKRIHYTTAGVIFLALAYYFFNLLCRILF